MVHNILRERPPGEVGSPREQVFPEAPPNQAGDHVDEASQYDNPGGFEVEIPAPAVLVGQYEPVAGVYPWPGGRDWKIEQGGRHWVAGFAPIEAWVRDYNFNSAEKQGEKAERSEP